jgi:hypothetical protein
MIQLKHNEAIFKLDQDLHEIKKKVDVLITLTELVSEEQPDEEIDIFGILIYNAICSIETLPYLAYGKEFSELKADLNSIPSITTELLEEKLVEIEKLLTVFNDHILQLSIEEKTSIQFVSAHRLPTDWMAWQDILEATIEEIRDVMMFHSEH